jgi:hypothetical protein
VVKDLDDLFVMRDGESRLTVPVEEIDAFPLFELEALFEPEALHAPDIFNDFNNFTRSAYHFADKLKPKCFFRNFQLELPQHFILRQCQSYAGGG